MRFPRFLAAVACALAAALVAAPAAHASFRIGIGDQKLGMWSDPRFEALGIQHVRLIVAYDLVLAGDYHRYDAWMASARARGADVMIAINHSTKSHTRLPSTRQYRRVIRRLRARYPEVRTYTAWNEANHWTQPTARRPRAAAGFYNALREECRGCTIVAADVLDQSGLAEWLAEFRGSARRPRLWGLHNYADVNRFRPARSSGMAALLRMVRGEVWLTETGGIVHFGRTNAFRGGRAGEARAARATRHTFALARSNPRVKRVYLYHWDAEPGKATWDSGLVRSDGRARPALDVVRAEINRQRSRQALPRVPRLPLRLPRP